MNKDHTKKIIFLVPYPFGIAPGQRFRYEQYLENLKNQGAKIRIQSFLDEKTYTTIYRPGYGLLKILSLAKGFLGRIVILPAVLKADFIFIYREVTPIGPPVFEWIIAHVFRRKIIYDFDDAIWLTDRKKESLFLRIIKWRSKVASICKWSYKVSCGNQYLCDYARQFTKDVIYNPTTIDTDNLHNKDLYSIKKNSNTVTIGWTGSHSTLKYLKLIEAELQSIEKKYPEVRFLVIADQKPSLELNNLKFIPWSLTTEVADLLESDIGIMPLTNDEWSQGKCGFKALQYMALEIPAVISPVGVNASIVQQGETGFLCSTSSDWMTALEKLISDRTLRAEMGKNGRQKIVRHFSVESNKDNFSNLFT